MRIRIQRDFFLALDLNAITTVSYQESQTKPRHPVNLDEMCSAAATYIVIPPLQAQAQHPRAPLRPRVAAAAPQRALIAIYVLLLFVSINVRLLPLHSNLKIKFYTLTSVASVFLFTSLHRVPCCHLHVVVPQGIWVTLGL